MEIWKNVKGYEEGYEISNLGRLRTKGRVVDYGWKKAFRKPKILKTRICPKRGYEYTVISIDKKRKTVKIHRLVAEAFIFNEYDKPQVNHINGIKHDNRASNLEWSTAKENANHAYETGLRKGVRGSLSHLSKLTPNEVEAIRNKHIKYNVTQRSLADEFNVSQSQISRILRRDNWA